MGYFTWTLANKKNAKLPYGGRGVVICPDNSKIEENHYEGYGEFDGQDIYELVVDWNRNHLMEIVEEIKEIEGENFWGKSLVPLIKAYQNNDMLTIEKEADKLYDKAPYLATDWKRNIGITIACKYNDIIPYPIKIVDSKSHYKKYENLPASESTQ